MRALFRSLQYAMVTVFLILPLSFQAKAGA